MNRPRFLLRRTARARRLSVAVAPDGTVTVTAPPRFAERRIATFIQEHRDWILRTLQRVRPRPDEVYLPRDRRSYLEHKATARAVVREFLALHAPRLGVEYGDVRIKDMTRNWGSCSEKANLNFNYKLALIPRELAEYVVVHELAHLTHFDHSPAFWAHVGTALPDWRARRSALRKYHA